MKLRRCGHAMCAPCLAKHTAMLQAKGLPIWCPVCRRHLEIRDVLSASRPSAVRCLRADNTDCEAEEESDSLATPKLPQLQTQQHERQLEKRTREAERLFDMMARNTHMVTPPRMPLRRPHPLRRPLCGDPRFA